MFLLSCLAVFLVVWIEVKCQDCREGMVRLVGGNSSLEGRVEIFLDGYWGTVCDFFWGQDDATVVCRQLGLSTEGPASFEPGTGPIAWRNIQCAPTDRRLVNCSRPVSRYCGHDQDVGVRCKDTPHNVTVDATTRDTSVLVRWSGSPEPDKYNITVTTTSSASQTHSIISVFPGNQSEAEYADLNPKSNYSICVIAIYCNQQAVSSCINIQTLADPSILTSPSNGSQERKSTLSVGILGFIIAVLVFLLIVAGVGLAYPRCIRHRVKDKKYLSDISQFLDRTMYMTNNEAYINRSQANQGRNFGRERYIPSAYETTSDPPTSQATPGEPRHAPLISEVTADIVAQHYEMFESRPSVPKQSENFEVPASGGDDSQQDAVGVYSYLEY